MGVIAKGNVLPVRQKLFVVEYDFEYSIFAIAFLEDRFLFVVELHRG